MSNCRSRDFAHGVTARIVLTQITLDRIRAEMTYQSTSEMTDQDLALLGSYCQGIETLIKVVPTGSVDLHWEKYGITGLAVG